MLTEHFHGAAKDFRWQMLDPVCDGATGYARWLFSYTSTLPGAEGRRCVFKGMSRFELRDGLIARYTEVFDRGLALAQLDFPPERIARHPVRPRDAARLLEQAMQAACESCGVPTMIRPGFAGLWTDEVHKIGSLGVADTLANIGSRLDALEALYKAGHLGSVAVTDTGKAITITRVRVSASTGDSRVQTVEGCARGSSVSMRCPPPTDHSSRSPRAPGWLVRVSGQGTIGPAP